MAVESDNNISLYANAAGWTDPNVRAVAIAIALAESGGNASATNHNTNGSTDYGLWQINSIHSGILAQGQWSNPEDNAKMAHQIYADAGNKFTPWVTYTRGTYLAFMPRARAAANAKLDGLKLKSGDMQNPLSNLTSAAFWRRVAFAVVGGIMILWALFKMTGDNQLSEGTKAALKLGAKAAIA